MKRTEFAMVVLIAAGSVLIAYFVAHAIFGGMTTRSVSVQTIQKIDSNFEQPDPAIFNSNAINPTVGISLSGTDTTSQ